MGLLRKPLAIDLYAGLGGWTEGFLAEGWRVIGFDIERRPYPAQLVIQDVLTLHGSQFKDAEIIVGSSPCQEFSYRAMPWKRAKALPPPRLGMELFNAQFRIRAEASEAAGRYIPLVVENVKGAQPWVGRAKAHFGSYYLWGDVESIGGAIVAGGVQFGNTLRAAKRVQKFNPDGTDHGHGSWFAIADSKNRGSGLKLPGNNGPRLWADREVQRLCDAPIKVYNSQDPRRKQAAAQIAKIPFELARYIASVYKPGVTSGADNPQATGLPTA